MIKRKTAAAKKVNTKRKTAAVEKKVRVPRTIRLRVIPIDVELQLTADQRRDLDLLVSTRGWTITRIFCVGLRRVGDYESGGGLSSLRREVTESE
jgi:hypothetical protein